MSLFTSLLDYTRMIRFSHSVFALPFALASLWLAGRYHPLTWAKVGWIVAAMIFGRSAAMGLNRIIDADIDRLNPRTSNREIPRGAIAGRKASVFTLVCALIFILCAFQLNIACGLLSFPVLAVFFIYPYAKRFTWMSHFVLGLCLAMAPLGAWLGISGNLQGPIIFMAAGVLLWVAGFDVIYSLLDLEFDKAQGLHSMPRRFGIQKALTSAMVFHGIALGCLIWVGIAFRLNFSYFSGCAVVAAVLLYEHNMVARGGPATAQSAFNVNVIIGIVYLASVWMGTL